MMRPIGQVLLPASLRFVWGSLLLCLVADMVPLGRVAWRPSLLAIALVFWCVREPRTVGVGTAFALGVLMDVSAGSLLGSHALAFTFMGFVATSMSRRLVWFGLMAQAAQTAAIFMVGTLAELAAGMASRGNFPGWWLFLAPALQAALWPVFSVILLAPQRRAADRDDIRPL